MDEDFVLPTDSTQVDLPAEATETKCEIKSGEIVLLMSGGRAKMPDGTIRQSIKDCKFQNGSSFMIYHGDKNNNMIAVKNNNKPRQKTFPAVVVPSSTTPVYDDTVPTVEVPSSQTSRQLNNNIGVDPIIAGAIGLAALTAIASSSVANSAKMRKAKKLQQMQVHNNKRQEEQGKCNSNSDAVKTLISMTEEVVNTSPVNRIEIKPSEDLISRVNENNNELKKLNKEIRILEDKLTKVTKV